MRFQLRAKILVAMTVGQEEFGHSSTGFGGRVPSGPAREVCIEMQWVAARMIRPRPPRPG
jgi:hypothetical protein